MNPMTDTRADGLEVFRELMPGIMPDDVKACATVASLRNSVN